MSCKSIHLTQFPVFAEAQALGMTCVAQLCFLFLDIGCGKAYFIFVLKMPTIENRKL